MYSPSIAMYPSKCVCIHASVPQWVGLSFCPTIALHCIALHCIALHCIAWHDMTWHCIALHCIALHCIALHWIALNRIALHYIYVYYNRIRYFRLCRSLNESPDHIAFYRHPLYTSPKVLTFRDGCNDNKKNITICFFAVLWFLINVNHNF